MRAEGLALSVVSHPCSTNFEALRFVLSTSCASNRICDAPIVATNAFQSSAFESWIVILRFYYIRRRILRAEGLALSVVSHPCSTNFEALRFVLSTSCASVAFVTLLLSLQMLSKVPRSSHGS